MQCCKIAILTIYRYIRHQQRQLLANHRWGIICVAAKHKRFTKHILNRTQAWAKVCHFRPKL